MGLPDYPGNPPKPGHSPCPQGRKLVVTSRGYVVHEDTYTKCPEFCTGERKMSATSPSHYNRFLIEPIDFIRVNNLGFLEGNVIKYVMRAPYKGNEVEDLEKARQYLDWMIDRAKAKEDKC